MKKFLLMLCAVMLVFGLVKSANASIFNAGFETGDLSGWTSGGQAGVQSDVVYEGNFAAWIGTVDFDNDGYNDFTNEEGTEGYTNNWISQTVDVTGMSTLSLWYNFYTWDYTGYDEPGFEIQINGSPVLSINAADIDTTGDLDWTGWQLFTYDLTGYAGNTLDLTVYAGNTVDSSYQSWAYIDNTAPVPLPSTILLMGTGLGCIGLFGRKAKKKITG